MKNSDRNTAQLVLLVILCIIVAFWGGAFNLITARQIVNGRYDDEIRTRVLVGAVDDAVDPRVQIRSRLRNEWIVHWYGVEMRQFPNDLVTYQETISKLRPDVIIETGTFAGGLTLYLAGVLRDVKPDARIVSVDIDSTKWDESRSQLDLDEGVKQQLLSRIHFIKGSSTSPEVLDEIKRQIPPGGKVLVILDSLHTRDHVLAELKLYSPLVTPGSYIIVNDTDLDGVIDAGLKHVDLPGYGKPCGVGAAVQEFLAQTDLFKADNALDRFSISCNHSGFLKRVE